jgi:hypothetical protein
LNCHRRRRFVRKPAAEFYRFLVNPLFYGKTSLPFHGASIDMAAQEIKPMLRDFLILRFNVTA